VNAYIEEHEPSGLHALDCDIWNTDDLPCDCRPTSPRLTTAERLDLLALDASPFQEAS
jgi:hypothetical protein